MKTTTQTLTVEVIQAEIIAAAGQEGRDLEAKIEGLNQKVRALDQHTRADQEREALLQERQERLKQALCAAAAQGEEADERTLKELAEIKVTLEGLAELPPLRKEARGRLVVELVEAEKSFAQVRRRAMGTVRPTVEAKFHALLLEAKQVSQSWAEAVGQTIRGSDRLDRSLAAPMDYDLKEIFRECYGPTWAGPYER